MARKERKTPDRNVILREHYRMLREAGFSPAEATRFRGASREKILEAIRTKKLPPLREEKAVRRGMTGWRKVIKSLPPNLIPKPFKGRLNVLGDYILVKPGLSKIYHAKYSYLVWYLTKTKDGEYIVKRLIYQSDEMIKSRKELFRRIYENIFADDENERLYQGSEVILSSLTLEGAYYNPEFE